MKRILVVDDEPGIASICRDYLEKAGFGVTVAGTGSDALAQARSGNPDLVVLDLGLPKMDGLDVTRALRQHSSVPIIMLTARVEESDKLVGLELGADDYLTKPFSLRELTARVHAVLRRMEKASRAGSDAPPPILVGDLEINRAERRVRRAGVEAHLTPTEFDLLVHLARRPRAVLPRERLLADIWGWADASGTRTVDSHIKALRRKLGADLIRTVHGVGYALEPHALETSA